MRKPEPVAPSDPVALIQCLVEAREQALALHAVAMDATSPERVLSRKELRRRASRMSRRLVGLLDAIEHPASAPVQA